jgi:hypothetical protein
VNGKQQLEEDYIRISRRNKANSGQQKNKKETRQRLTKQQNEKNMFLSRFVEPNKINSIGSAGPGYGP